MTLIPQSLTQKPPSKGVTGHFQPTPYYNQKIEIGTQENEPISFKKIKVSNNESMVSIPKGTTPEDEKALRRKDARKKLLDTWIFLLRFQQIK